MGSLVWAPRSVTLSDLICEQRSICGSLLTQERGEDLTRSETYLYMEVWEPRQDAGAPCKSGYMDLETFSSGFILECMAKWLKRHFDHWRYPGHYSWKSNFSHWELGRRGKKKTIGKEAKLLTHFVATRVSNLLWRLGELSPRACRRTETSRCSFASTVIHDARRDGHVFRSWPQIRSISKFFFIFSVQLLCLL